MAKDLPFEKYDCVMDEEKLEEDYIYVMYLIFLLLPFYKKGCEKFIKDLVLY